MSRKTKTLIIILAAICSSLIVFFIIQKKQFPKTPLPFPSLSLSPTSIPVPPGYVDVFTEQEQTKENYYPLLEKTPYRTPRFELSYSGPLRLKVIMYSKNQTEVKNEVYPWLKENGVEPTTHQIDFLDPSEITTPGL